MNQMLKHGDGLPTFDGDFDGVLMLTWSDWKTEPRSNRYHYGSRFAKIGPVLFLQPGQDAGGPIHIEPSGLPGMDLVSFPHALTGASIDQLLALLRERGIRKPLLWIYSAIHYGPLLRALPHAFRVYHATEDYLTPSPQWSSQVEVTAALRALLKDTDMLVGVSEKVNRAYVELGEFQGPVVLAPNGCDASFFQSIAATSLLPPEPRTCIFQGGINGRLDYDLLTALVERLPDWTFWFCGKAVDDLAGWKKLQMRRNVKYLGCLTPEQFGRKMCEATVGLIPFIQEDMIWNSLPLKAYEYVACGLPVVSVPIAALEGQPELFATASTAEEFARAITDVAASRLDPQLLALRSDTAQRNSYDGRFAEVVTRIRAVAAHRRDRPKRLNVCVLYDPNSVRVNTIREHLESFSKYSRHQVFFMPATDHAASGFSVRGPSAQPVQTGASPIDLGSIAEEPDLSLFDVVIVHFCVRVCVDGHMTPAVERSLARYRGMKVLFIQDEYDTPEVARQWMERVDVNIVYTCVPEGQVQKLYPPERFPWVRFRSTLTGYVPEDASIDEYALPLHQRPNLIGYRGRMLPPIYGELGWEKYLIGREVKKMSEERGLPVDIEVDDSKRVYGRGWYQFLGAARATLGTESGCNLFDFDGSAARLIRARQADDPDLSYWSLRQELSPYEGVIRMNQISPKIFESIRTRTALVLFEGSYSDVVQPTEHFIPLKKDFSNFDQVVRLLHDDAYLKELTDRAYRDIIESGRYSYASFVHGVDEDLQRNLVRGPRVRLFSLPVLGWTVDGKPESVEVERVSRAFLTSDLVDAEPVRAAFRAYADRAAPRLVSTNTPAESGGTEVAPETGSSSLTSRTATVVRTLAGHAWDALPAPVRGRISRGIRKLAIRHSRPDVEKSGVDRTLSKVWELVPASAKRAARRLVYRE